MNEYYNNLNNEVKEYFKILSPEFPEWLLEYINTPEMNRISKIRDMDNIYVSIFFRFLILLIIYHSYDIEDIYY